jgi:acyl-CoA hydrolase
MNAAFKKIKSSSVIISELMLPSHTNFNGKIHGGYILSLMDQIAFSCASKHSENYCVTAGVDTVDFLNPIEIGELVTMKASVNYVGTSSMMIGIRVDAENIQTGKKKHCNSSYFTMVAKSKDHKSVRVPGLILTNKNEVRRFVRGLTRHEMRSNYKKEFNNMDFSSEELLNKLKNYRVKMEV